MTVTAQTSSNSSTGNGVTTVFPYTFKIIDDGDIEVRVDGVLQTLSTHYTVSGVGDNAGGNVTMLSAPANGAIVARRRNMALVREVDYQYQGTLPAAVLNPDQDAPVLMVQQMQEQISRSVRGPAGETWSELPAAASRLDKLLAFDSTTGELELSGVTQTQVASAVAAAYAAGSTADAVTFLPAGTGAVSRTVQAKLRESVSVRDFGAIGDGVTDDTAAIQAAITASYGQRLVFPEGAYKHGPLTITGTISLLFEPGSTVVPVFDTGTLQKLYEVTGAGVTIDGLTISTVAATNSANKYIIFADTGADDITVMNCSFTDITADDGNSGITNLLVTHGIYLQNISRATVKYNRIDNISGAAIFVKNVTGLVICKNRITDTGWYSINLDHTVEQFEISGNVIDGADVNARYWGGSINLQSNVAGTKNKRGKVFDNWITGVHNYGSVIRLQSCEDVEVIHNQIYDCTDGSLAADTDVQNISIDRRGTAEGSPEGGECVNVLVAHNVLRAGTGVHTGVYLKNQYLATRDPHKNLTISDNIIMSPSASAYYQTAISVHGFKSGFDGLKIEDNFCEVLTDAGASVGGAIGVVSTQASGAITGLSIQRNQIVDIDTVAPANTSHIGIYLQATISDGARVQGNYLKNFYYGTRVAASNGLIYGLEDQVYVNCLTNTLFSTASPGGAFDMSLGTALPVTGVYKVGHIRQNPNAAASASFGWVVTTAGGAMTAAWLTAQAYVAGTWYRNAAGRVYELITAGGGNTSVEPAGTTVGANETGADGYVWQCRSTTSARWSTLPALGAAVALP